MDRKLKELVLSIIYRYRGPLTFSTVFALVNKGNRRFRHSHVKQCIILLEKEKRIEIIDDLYKYYHHKNTEYHPDKLYSTDFCYMSVSNMWQYFTDMQHNN